jgi:glucokinase
LLSERLRGFEIVIDNDVTVVTYGEWRFGAGLGAEDLMCVTVGTGVGAGLILGGKPYAGSGRAAGEIGSFAPLTTGALLPPTATPSALAMSQSSRSKETASPSSSSVMQRPRWRAASPRPSTC